MPEWAKMIEARALIAFVVLTGLFIELPIVMYFAFSNLEPTVALDFIRWTFMLLYTPGMMVVSYFFGAKNGEKREEIRQYKNRQYKNMQTQTVEVGGVKIV